MAKTKSVMAKKDDKATKTIEKKPREVKAKVPVPEMVMTAMQEIGDTCTLQLIRGYITREFKARMSKKLQGSIKEYLQEEFQHGRLKMLDHDGDQFKFNKKFQLVEKK